MTKAVHERLATLYAAFRRGQLDFVLNGFSDDIEFISYSPVAIFPFLGHRRGKAAVAEALRGAHQEFEIISYEPMSMLVEDREAAVVLFVRGINRKSRRSLQLSVAHFIRFRNGKIAEIKEFMDSFNAAEQVLGRELDIRSEDIHLLQAPAGVPRAKPAERVMPDIGAGMTGFGSFTGPMAKGFMRIRRAGQPKA